MTEQANTDPSAAGGNGSRLPPSILRPIDRFLGWFLRGLLPEEKRYWVLVPLTGIAAGLFAVGLANLLDLIQAALWGHSGFREGVIWAEWWVRVLIPTAAGAVIALVTLFFGKEKAPEGTSGLIEALAVSRGKLPFWRTLLGGILSIGAVGSGASLGREGAMIQSGAAFGSWLGEKFRLKENHVKVLLACGAAGGIAAAYNVPFGASVYAMEILLGSFALELFGPIVVCSVIATAISRYLLSEASVYEPPPYSFESWEVFLYVILGAFLGGVSVLFIRIFSGLDVLAKWFHFKKGGWAKPFLAMAALGVAGIWFPDLFGNGFGTVNLVLGAESRFPIHLLFVLPALKILFTAICRAGGIPGGLFTPSIFVGALLGAGFAHIVSVLTDWPISPPGAYALIGMGAIIAGTLKAPITAILLVFELTRANDYSVILPIMSACITSTLVSHGLQRGSLFTESLRRKGILLPETLAPSWLREPLVREYINPSVETVHAAERFDKVMDAFLRTPLEHNRLYVVDQAGTYLGAISLHEIKLFFRESEHLDPVIAIDLVDSSFPCVHASDPISRAIEILAERDAERLPVLDGPDSRKLLGSISKRQLLRSYRSSTLARTG